MKTNKSKKSFQFNRASGTLSIKDESELQKALEKNNIHNVARNMKVNPPCYYYNLAVSGVIHAIIEISYKTEEKQNLQNVTVNVLTKIEQVVPLFKEFLDLIFNKK